MSSDRFRFSYIDVAKGLAMLFVVMHHCGGSLDRGMQVLTMTDVPLFFLCSGFIAFKHNIDYKNEIIKKAKGILIPFVIAVFFIMAVRRIGIMELMNDITKSGYWFLEALFLIFLLYWSITAISRRQIIRYILWGGVEVILLASAKFLPSTIDNIFCISSLARYYPCFMVGVFLREYKIESFNRYIGLGLLILAIIGFSDFFNSKNLSFIMYILAYATSAIILFYAIKHFERDIPVSIHRMLSYFGKYSLSIYLIHFFFIPKTPAFIPDSFVFHFVYSLITSVIVAYLSLLIGRLLSFITPLNKVLR